VERNPREVRFRVFHKNRMRFRSDESSTNYAGRRRAERFGFAIAQPWFDRRRTKIGGVSSLLRRTVVWQDIFFQIEVFCWRGVFDSWEAEEKTHAKPQRLGGSVNGKKGRHNAEPACRAVVPRPREKRKGRCIPRCSSSSGRRLRPISPFSYVGQGRREWLHSFRA